jgi:hypothetical protein
MKPIFVMRCWFTLTTSLFLLTINHYLLTIAHSQAIIAFPLSRVNYKAYLDSIEVYRPAPLASETRTSHPKMDPGAAAAFQ